MAARRMQHDAEQGGSPGAAQRAVSKIISFDHFERMNTKSARQTLDESEAAWLENLQPIAGNNLTAVPAALSALASISPDTASKMYGANIGNIDFIIVFTAAGAGIAINASNGVKTTFATAGTFTNPDMTGYNSARILIIDTSSAGYCTWDGTLFVQSGGISPNIQVTNGGTYAATPSITISGGSGSGATAHAVMGGSGASQFVASVVLDNPGTGYKTGDTITVSASPASTFAATARIWPQVTGTTIAVFAGRVWWANGRILNFTGTQGYDDTNTANAAGSTTITDADLAHSITALRSLNNYLYIFGDQSIKQVGSITVASSVTLFTILTLSSDIGTSFPLTVQSYNRFAIFANKNGVYGVLGASVQKISDDLDGIFQLTDFSQKPASALNDLRNIHCYLLLLRYLDPVLGPRSIIVAFQEKKWFVISQGSLTAMCSLPLASTTQIETFGSSSGNINQLLQDSTTAVDVKLITSLTHHGNLVQAKQVIRSGIAVTTQNQATVTLQIDTENGSIPYSLSASTPITWLNNSQQQVTWLNNSAQVVTFVGGGFKFPYTDADGYGKFLGATVMATQAAFSINAVAIEYQEKDLWGGSAGI